MKDKKTRQEAFYLLGAEDASICPLPPPEFNKNYNGDFIPGPLSSYIHNFKDSSNNQIFELFNQEAINWWNQFPDNEYENLNFVYMKKSKADYSFLPDKIMVLFVYLFYIIQENKTSDACVTKLTEYLFYYLSFFGEKQIGTKLLYDLLLSLLDMQIFIDKISGVNSSKNLALKTAVKKLKEQYAKSENFVRIKALINTVKKWQSTLPNLNRFEVLKKENPIKKIYSKYEIINKFDSDKPTMAVIDFFKRKTLISILLELTAEVSQLISTDNLQLIKEGKISKIELESQKIEDEAHKFKQSNLLAKVKGKSEKYEVLLEQWLENERTYFERKLSSQHFQKKVAIEKHFTLNKSIKEEALRDLHNQLQVLGCFEESQTFAKFRKLFSNKEMKEPFVWSGYFGDLCTLISSLVKAELISPKRAYFKIAQSIFVDSNNVAFESDKFKGWKPSSKEESIIAYVNELKDSIQEK